MNDYDENIDKYKNGIQALEAKKEYQKLGGVNDYGENIEEYKTDIQALKYKKLLNSEESDNLSDKEKEKIYKFYNKNYKDNIQEKNKLRIDILRKKFNKYNF